MNYSTRSTGLALATAAAMLFGSVVAGPANAEEAKIHCTGVNGCKGQSACATAKNSCQGQNSCKGQGFLVLTQKDCDAAKAKIAQEEK